MNRYSIFFVFVLLLPFYGCSHIPESQPGHLFTPEHHWSHQELSLLKNLWLGSLTQKYDSSNKFEIVPEARVFGEKLFFDTRFSSNGKISCSSCHKPDEYFTDARKVAQGVDATTRNTPTIVGASNHHWFFSDGRADSLWSQALGPLENEREHGGNRTQYAHIIYNDPQLREFYESVFGPMPDLSDKQRFPPSAGPVENQQAYAAWNNMSKEDQQLITQLFVNMGKALAAYEKQLQPSTSRFDTYVEAALRNDTRAMTEILTKDEAAGLRIFTGKGTCIICHSGPMLTDGEFHNINTVDINSSLNDVGRYNGARAVLNSEFNCRSSYNDDNNKSCPELTYMVLDKHETVGAFKTPGLRNISRTAPYMHDGQYKTLKEVLQHYNKPPARIIGQTSLLVRIQLSNREIDQLEAFLFSLNDQQTPLAN